MCAVALAPIGAIAQGFKFEKDPGAQQQAAEAAARQGRVAANLSTPCKDAIKNKKIAVIIGEEQTNGVVLARQENYGPHFQLINGRLQTLGLRTYTPDEIRKQIAQAEIDAYFKNNPDAALSAAKRLGANFVLRGLITSQAAYNPIVRVNQVSVGMGFTLAASDGRTVANAAANAASYAGPDVRAMALTLLNENADEVVSRLYSEYCRNAEVAAPAKSRK
ncbi:MAG TPA: hypothetical protein VLC47_11085 [Burkholderiales bacterium]|nr:hypothetical protein [Burkholderiales bacterium]